MKFLTNLVILALLLTLAWGASIPSVIIVGAGMSGISAGKKLQENGIRDFIILEATNRIGGRIHKTEFAGHIVEKGANWLHGVGGPQKNPLYEMAKQIQLKSFYSGFDNISSNTYKQDGGLYPKSAVDAAFHKTKENEEYGTKIAKQLSTKDGKDDDMSLLALERLNRMEPSTPLEKMVDFHEFDGNKQNPPRLKFNQVVTEVVYTKTGVTLKTEDGKVYQAKTVILSPSVGVLQSDLIKFKPELPMWKRRAINEFSLGVYTKIFLKFPTKFWPTQNGTEFFLYTHQRRGYYAIWQHLENEYPGSNILFVTVTDEESERIEQQPDEDTKAEAIEVLRKMFGKGLPDPTDIMIPRWKSDRFYRGSFSNWPVGYTQEKHNHLRAPIGRVYFTGEHTHPIIWICGWGLLCRCKHSKGCGKLPKEKDMQSRL